MEPNPFNNWLTNPTLIAAACIIKKPQTLRFICGRKILSSLGLRFGQTHVLSFQLAHVHLHGQLIKPRFGFSLSLGSAFLISSQFSLGHCQKPEMNPKKMDVYLSLSFGPAILFGLLARDPFISQFFR